MSPETQNATEKLKGTPPIVTIYRALKTMQFAQLKALNTGEGWGLTTQEMAELLDQELGFSKLVKALERIAATGPSTHAQTGDAHWAMREIARAALAKLRRAPAGPLKRGK